MAALENIDIFFVSKKDSIPGPVPIRTPTPYVRDIYKLNLTDTTGFLTFNGYYYVEDHPPPYPEDDALEPWRRPQRNSVYLPQYLMMNVHLDKQVTTYEIKCIRREIHECTDEYGEEIDGMQVCFFPTNKQTIYFEILEKIEAKDKK
jgi:hypothetical protein